MELLLEYTAKKFQNLFQGKGSLPASVTLSQFFACFLLPWLLAPAKQKVVINFYKSRQLLLNYGLITMLVFGATALATASLIYVSRLLKRPPVHCPSVHVSVLCTSINSGIIMWYVYLMIHG